eukprot:scaffold618_cov130-Cylindrotheca_fusiformis.AAC.5
MQGHRNFQAPMLDIDIKRYALQQSKDDDDEGRVDIALLAMAMLKLKHKVKRTHEDPSTDLS